MKYLTVLVGLFAIGGLSACGVYGNAHTVEKGHDQYVKFEDRAQGHYDEYGRYCPVDQVQKGNC